MIGHLHITSFGKLRDCDFSLDNLNCIIEDNGFGKTTLCGFICAMFYGLGDSKNVDRQKYAPWQNSDDFGGTMDFAYQGRVYTVSRMFAKSAKNDRFSVEDKVLGKDVTKEFEHLGEKVFGLDKNSFYRCFYIPQEDVQLRSTDSFSQRLTDMVEGGKGQEAIDLLDKQSVVYLQKKKRDGRKQGLLGDLAYEITQTQKQLEQAAQKKSEIEDLKYNIEQYVNRNEQYQKKVNALNATLDASSELKSRYDAQLSFVKQKADFVNMQLQSLPQGVDYEAIPENISTAKKLIDKSNTENESRRKTKRNNDLIAYCLFAVAAMLIGIGITVTVALSAFVWLGITLIVSGVASVVLAAVFKTKKINISEYSLDNELNRLLAPFYTSADSVDIAYTKLQELYNRHNALYAEAQAIARSAQTDVAGFDPQAYANTLKERDTLAKQLQEGKQTLAGLVATKQEKQSSLADTAELTEKISNLTNEYNKGKQEYHTILLAKECLEQAKENLAQLYLPKMADTLSQDLSQLTDGAIKQAKVDVDFNIDLIENGFAHSADSFSLGTKQLAFFAFRLALCKMIYKDEIPFVLIDDTFVNYDEERFDKAIEYLQSLSQHTQIIYLTCHDRGKKLIEGEL